MSVYSPKRFLQNDETCSISHSVNSRNIKRVTQILRSKLAATSWIDIYLSNNLQLLIGSHMGFSLFSGHCSIENLLILTNCFDQHHPLYQQALNLVPFQEMDFQTL